MIPKILLFCALVQTVFANKYNVLFIIVDDLRPALGAYQYKNAYTPNIDKLANKSFVFKNAFAQQALCAPSRNSFLTSRRPNTLHLYDFYNYWRHTVGNFTTLPQHFKNNAYITHSVGKVFHPGISSNHTDDYPYSWTNTPFHPKTQKYKNARVCLNEDGNYAANIVCPVHVSDHPGHTLPDLEVLDAAKFFLKKMKNSFNRYFLAVGFQKPHIPLKFPRKYLDMHPLNDIELPSYIDKPSAMPNVAWNPWNDFRIRDDIKRLKLSFPFERIPLEYTQKIIQSYNAAVTYIDDLIGNLLEHVDFSQTTVILIGDHGISLGDHGEFGKYSNFDIATRVPMIIYIPNTINKKVELEKVVELVDIFPTLVQITNVSTPIKPCSKNDPNDILCTEGKNLLDDMMMAKYLPHKIIENCVESFAISQYPRPSEYPTMDPDSDKPILEQIKIMGYSLRNSVFRYTEWVSFNPKTFKSNFTHVYAKELYNHDIDKNEDMNLAEYSEMQSSVNDLHNKLIEALNINCQDN